MKRTILIGFMIFAMFTKAQFLEAFGKIPGSDPCRIVNHIHVTLA